MTQTSACARTLFRLDDLETFDFLDDSAWTTACAYDQLGPCRGVGVLMPDGTQVALFRLEDGSLWAIGNVEPWCDVAVMSRGIVGDRAGRRCVQSPIKKQAFAFDDGTCLDDDAVRVPVYRTRVNEHGHVEVSR